MTRPTDPAVKAEILRIYHTETRKAAMDWIHANLNRNISERTFCDWVKKWGGRKIDRNDGSTTAATPTSALTTPSHHPNVVDSLDMPADDQQHVNSPGCLVAQDIGRPDSPVLGQYDFAMGKPSQPLASLDEESVLVVNQNNQFEQAFARSRDTTSWPSNGCERGHTKEQGNTYHERNEYARDRSSGSAGCISPAGNSRHSKDSGYYSATGPSSAPWSPIPVRNVERFETTNDLQPWATTEHLIHLQPHAGHSACPQATGSPYQALLSRDSCSLCKAAGAHFLGIMAHTLQPNDLIQRLHSLPDLDQRDDYGNTPIHFVASSSPTLDLFRIVQGAGANLSVTNHEGDTILHLLDLKNFHTVQDLIVLLGWCEENGLSMRQRRIDGQTILHAILLHVNDPSWVHTLKEFFAARSIFMHSRDSNGYSPLDIIKPLKPRKEYQLLSDYHEPYERLAARNKEMQQTVSAEDTLGRNGINWLAYIASLPANARLTWLGGLLRKRIDVNHYDKNGYTPLHSFMLLTRQFGSDGSDEQETNECIKKILHAGADVRLRDRAGNTALHLACSNGRVLCVETLLHQDSLVNATNKAGRTVISEARRWLRDADSVTTARVEEAIDKIKRLGGLESLQNSG